MGPDGAHGLGGRRHEVAPDTCTDTDDGDVTHFTGTAHATSTTVLRAVAPELAPEIRPSGTANHHVVVTES